MFGHNPQQKLAFQKLCLKVTSSKKEIYEAEYFWEKQWVHGCWIYGQLTLTIVLLLVIKEGMLQYIYIYYILWSNENIK